MPSPEDTLKAAAHVYTSRKAEYGDMVTTAQAAADIATVLLGMPFTPYQINLVMMAVKQARIVKNPGHQPNYEDLINYAAFAAAFAPASGVQAEKAA